MSFSFKLYYLLRATKKKCVCLIMTFYSHDDDDDDDDDKNRQHKQDTTKQPWLQASIMKEGHVHIQYLFVDQCKRFHCVINHPYFHLQQKHSFFLNYFRGFSLVPFFPFRVAF